MALVRRRGGDARAPPPLLTTARDFVAGFHDEASHGYVFARNPFETLDLERSVPPPVGFFDDPNRFSRDARTREATALFYLGARASMTNFHEHSNAYNMLLHGAKQGSTRVQNG